MIVLDASALIGYFNARDGFHETAKTIVWDAIQNGRDLTASEMTLAEFLVEPVRSGTLDRATAALEDIGLSAVQLPASFAAPLATVRHETHTKLPDACVLLAARDLAHANEEPVAVATFDARVAKGAEVYGLTVLGYNE